MSAPRDRSRSAGNHAELVRSRYLSNCFGELDRFLNHLCDTISVPTGPRRHNAALKLSKLTARASTGPSDQHRLRAIGRSRACLRYCGGIVTRGDTADAEWLTCGWTDRRTGVLARYRIGAAARPTNSEVIDICSFYDDLSMRIVGPVAEASARFDLDGLAAPLQGSVFVIPERVSPPRLVGA